MSMVTKVPPEIDPSPGDMESIWTPLVAATQSGIKKFRHKSPFWKGTKQTEATNSGSSMFNWTSKKVLLRKRWDCWSSIFLCHSLAHSAHSTYMQRNIAYLKCSRCYCKSFSYERSDYLFQSVAKSKVFSTVNCSLKDMRKSFQFQVIARRNTSLIRAIDLLEPYSLCTDWDWSKSRTSCTTSGSVVLILNLVFVVTRVGQHQHECPLMRCCENQPRNQQCVSSVMVTAAFPFPVLQVRFLDLRSRTGVTSSSCKVYILYKTPRCRWSEEIICRENTPCFTQRDIFQDIEVLVSLRPLADYA